MIVPASVLGVSGIAHLGHPAYYHLCDETIDSSKSANRLHHDSSRRNKIQKSEAEDHLWLFPWFLGKVVTEKECTENSKEDSLDFFERKKLPTGLFS